MKKFVRFTGIRDISRRSLGRERNFRKHSRHACLPPSPAFHRELHTRRISHEFEVSHAPADTSIPAALVGSVSAKRESRVVSGARGPAYTGANTRRGRRVARQCSIFSRKRAFTRRSCGTGQSRSFPEYSRARGAPIAAAASAAVIGQFRSDLGRRQCSRWRDHFFRGIACERIVGGSRS